jgi:hypothetical protein
MVGRIPSCPYLAVAWRFVGGLALSIVSRLTIYTNLT